MTGERLSLNHLQSRSLLVVTQSFAPLVGREREVELATSLLGREDVRLLTLTGPGGIGKTRLSLEIAIRLAPSYVDGAHVVPLSAVAHARLVTATVVRSLGIQERGDADLRDLLIGALRDVELLLVMDNFEHVEDAAPLISDLLSHCPRLKVMATSRSLLRLTGEHALPVPPLTVPDPQIAVSKEDVAESAAVRLFVERARAVVPTFTLSDANARAIASICHRLDGLPLAIELAATQTGILPPAALLNRIEAHLPLPVAGPRDAPDRHRTVHNAIAWSYDLLHTHEQRLFRYVGVFAGGFGIDAAEYLELAARDTALGDTLPARDVLNGLASLVDKSLLQQVAWQGDARFAMLETIRRFALDQMEASGEREAVGDAHADWCLELAERTRFAAITPGGEAQLVRIEMEHANIRAALEWLEQRGDVVRLLRLVTALREFWYENNHYREGRMWLERALVTATGAPDIERARALTQLGHLLSLQGDTTRAQTLLDQGLAALRNEGEMTEVALALVWRGAIANHLGTYEQAERYLQEALGMATSLPDPRIAASMTARALANLGIAAHGRGDLDEAIKRHEHALGICREHGYVLGVVRSLRDLGDVARDRGDSAGSLAYYRESLSLLGEQSDLRVVFDVLEGTALAAARWNRSEDAARLLGAAEALRDHLGTPVAVEPDRVAHQRAIAAISATLEAQGFDKAWSRGRRMNLSEAIAEVLAMSPPPIPERQTSHSVMRLSRREIEVLELLVAGHSDREIAEALSLSVRTVEGHVTHIREKLGVQTRTAAVAFAITTGLIDPASLSRD